MYPHFPAGGGFGLSVPHTTQISPPLSNGAQIHVSGTPTGNRFEVNLKSYQDDIVLHVNPRFDGNTLVINSAQRGSWGQEERHSLTLHRGARFTMVIMATDRSFKVAINNSHVCEFYQRSPMNLAQMVEVKGELTLDSVQVFPGQGAMGFPPAMGMGMGFAPPPPSFGGDMGYCPPPPQPSFGGGFAGGHGFPSAPPPPYGGSAFPGGSVPSIHSCRLHPGSRVFVRGTIHPGAKRFELNLLQGYSDGDDIAFHFNPRFDAHTIVKNHRRQGQWGSEENQPFPGYMPLMPGAPIDLEIACHHDKYTVFMNGQLIAEYYHKIPPGSVMALQYKGDITINSVGQA